MSITFEPKSRNVIPRWRDFATTIELGELSRAATSRAATPISVDLTELESDWQREGTLSFAADLISAAVLSGGSEVARAAARHVIEQGEEAAGESLSALAKNILKSSNEKHSPTIIETYGESEMRRAVADHKRRLAASPRNAILWVDLSLLYAVSGLKDKARRAMQAAIGLEPNNRFVLRSAARLYLHLDEPDRAHKLLRRSPAINFDPWIMAAEIATANSAGFISFAIDNGIRLLSRDTLDASDTTELFTAVATTELKNGSTSKAKKNLRGGLLSPNENSLAQVRWLLRDLRGFLPNLNVTDLNVQRSFEASVWEAHSKQDWLSAAEYCIRWFKDQPFSSRPATVGANIIAGLLENYKSAIQLANLGLIANPREHSLYIILAFAHGSSGHTKEAREALSQIKGTVSSSILITFLANQCLIAFREGQLGVGRTYYEAAVEKALALGESSLRAGALAYWATEEILVKSEFAEQTLNRAREAVKALGGNSGEVAALLTTVEKKLALWRETSVNDTHG